MVTENIAEIINGAFEKARSATQAMIDANPGQWYPCGFSWVKIRPATGLYVKTLKQMGQGKIDTVEGGYMIWNPSGNPTQWMDAKHEGSKAFAAILQAHGIDAKAMSRMD
jgi:hypothetical protein